MKMKDEKKKQFGIHKSHKNTWIIAGHVIDVVRMQDLIDLLKQKFCLD